MRSRRSRRSCRRVRVLITGAIRPPETPPNGRITRAYNSVYVIGHDGSILSVYDKVHLVPFGEYLPLQILLERLGLMQLTKMRGGFIAGDRRRNQPAPGAPNFVPLVCYEIIFPGDAVPRGERAGLALRSPRPLYRLAVRPGRRRDGRAGCSISPMTDGSATALVPISISSRRACARSRKGSRWYGAANTGISAVIDPLGRVVKSLPLGAEGVIDAPLPQRLAPTPYARVGDGPPDR